MRSIRKWPNRLSLKFPTRWVNQNYGAGDISGPIKESEPILDPDSRRKWKMMACWGRTRRGQECPLREVIEMTRHGDTGVKRGSAPSEHVHLTVKGVPCARFGLRPHLPFDTRGSGPRVAFTNPRSNRIDFTNRIISAVFQKWAGGCVIFRILDFPGIFIDDKPIPMDKIGNLHI